MTKLMDAIIQVWHRESKSRKIANTVTVRIHDKAST